MRSASSQMPCVMAGMSMPMTIVKNSTSKKSEVAELINAGREINTTYKLMTDWAKILIRGGEHREKAEKIK